MVVGDVVLPMVSIEVFLWLPYRIQNVFVRLPKPKKGSTMETMVSRQVELLLATLLLLATYERATNGQRTPFSLRTFRRSRRQVSGQTRHFLHATLTLNPGPPTANP